MNMIEVDPKLFVKCRLCLDETGQYQIVPKVQMQIKYCFDIDVELFDGLPQLICKKCESILCQYAGIKQIYQEKQSNLKLKLKTNVSSDNITQQQQDTVTSTQTEVENSSAHTGVKLFIRKSSILSNKSSSLEGDSHNSNDSTNRTTSKKNKKIWQDKTYRMYFVCRFCTKKCRSKKIVQNHIYKQCKIYAKHSKILKSYCLVKLTKADSNLTGSNDNVVCHENKIINSSNDKYYVLYTRKSIKRRSSESSAEDFIVDTQKRRRLRLLSGSSHETAIIEQKSFKRIISDNEDEELPGDSETVDHTPNISDIECVNLDDSDSASTKSSLKTSDNDNLPHKITTNNEKMINNIITMCSNKHMKGFNASKVGNSSQNNEESSLKHKILSIGSKVIHNKGINSTGILRYMEHKDLEVVWIPKIDSNVIIKTRPKESTDIENRNIGWENIKYIGNYRYKVQDFIDIYEKKIEFMSKLQETDTSYKKHNAKSQKMVSEKEPKENAKLYSSNPKTSDLKVNDPELGIVLCNLQTSGLIITDPKTDSLLSSALTSDLIVKDPKVNILSCKPKTDPKRKEPKVNLKNIEDIYNNPEPSTSSMNITPQTENTCQPATDNGITLMRNSVESDKQTSKKLLNANPVANPRQMPKKTNICEPARGISDASDAETQDNEDAFFVDKQEDLQMPIIMSTVSLAENTNEQENTARSQPNITNSPIVSKIKVKPASELLSERVLNQQNNAHTLASNWTMNNDNFPNINQNQDVTLHSNKVVYMTNTPVYANMVTAAGGAAPTVFFYPQYKTTPIDSRNVEMQQCNPPNVSNRLTQQSGSSPCSMNQDYVTLHTVEFPNTRTNSPFQYFQRLLQIHNIHLLDSAAMISPAMKCLSKFKVVLEQETKTPVTLHLFLFCDSKVFCIKAKDDLQKDLDIIKFSATWQWELLKVFKGDVVPKILQTAIKFGLEAYTKDFITLLKSIVFTS